MKRIDMIEIIRSLELKKIDHYNYLVIENEKGELI